MNFVAAILSALIWLFLWMYLLTYFMYRGAGQDFFSRARIGFLRGILVALVFIIFDSLPQLSGYIGRGWLLFPLIFFIFSIPFSWRRTGKSSLVPIVLWGVLFLIFSFVTKEVIFWSPFQEEIWKWYQSSTTAYPALMSPFVSLGFSFLENTRYYMTELSWGQILGRNLFSMPLHLFAGLLVFWCFFSIKSRILGTFLGLVAAVTLHTLYNWSLSSSLLLTLVIIVSWYAFYGWSLENGWWRKKI